MLEGCLFTIGAIFVFIGIVVYVTNRGGEKTGNQPRPSSTLGQLQSIFTQAERPAPQSVAPARPTTAPIGSTSSTVPPASDPRPLDWIQVGSRINVRHPQQGDLMVHVMGRVSFTELWQQRSGPQVPWTPTGNTFYGFWLETNRLLLIWQTRCYLLDEAIPTSDNEIQRDFASHAREFAQSNQTADVYFAYPPAMWHMDDIGKFQIASVEGEGFPLQIRAVGRFIHASGDSDRALVLEDYEGGSGQDLIWIGYKITPEDVKPG